MTNDTTGDTNDDQGHPTPTDPPIAIRFDDVYRRFGHTEVLRGHVSKGHTLYKTMRVHDAARPPEEVQPLVLQSV